MSEGDERSFDISDFKMEQSEIKRVVDDHLLFLADREDRQMHHIKAMAENVLDEDEGSEFTRVATKLNHEHGDGPLAE